MGEFFELLLGNMYCWFKSFYPENLSQYLWGYNPASGAYDLELRYNTIGLYTLIVSFIIMTLYYYVIDHPRFCKWWSWLIMATINSVIALFIGYYCVLSDYNAGKIPDELMYIRDENGEVVQTLKRLLEFWNKQYDYGIHFLFGIVILVPLVEPCGEIFSFY